MVAAINLAREGSEVSVLERGPEVGGAPYNPRIDVTPLDRSIWDYIGLNLDSCFQEVGRLDAYARSRHHSVTPKESVPFLYMVERGPRESSLDSHLYKEALRVGVKFEFSHPVRNLADVPDNSIIATGLNPQMLTMLEIPFTMADAYSGYMENSGEDRVAGAYLDDYTNDYFYSATINNMWFGLLWSRGMEISKDQLDKCAQQIEQRQGLKIKEWKHHRVGIAVKDLNNPRLFVGNKILAGPLSGMHDPLICFGVEASLVSGKVAALALQDKEHALEDFKKFNRHYERTYLLRKIYEFIAPSARLSLAEIALTYPELMESELLEPLFLIAGSIAPGHSDNTWMSKTMVKEGGLPYFDKVKEVLMKLLQENISRLL